MNQQLFPDNLFGAQQATQDPRKAALLLHAMSQDDRSWVLEHLPLDQRDELSDLLAELKDLGIPMDKGLLDEVVASSPPTSLWVDASLGYAPLSHDHLDNHGLDSADALLLGRILRNEPPGLIARLLDLSDWPWTEGLLEQLDLSRRRQVEALRNPAVCEVWKSGGEAGHALRAQLLRHIKARLADQEAYVSVDEENGLPDQSSTPTVRKAWWQRLRQLPRTWKAKRLIGHGLLQEWPVR